MQQSLPEVSRLGDAVKIAYTMPGIEWQTKIFLSSDRHFDSTHCNRDLLKRHYDEAVEAGATIIDTGDFFDIMQGRNDKRRAGNGKRPEVEGKECYYDSVIDEAVDFLAPYAKNIAYMGLGNHETAIIKFTEINPIRQLAARLNDRTGSKILTGGYEGWLKLHFTWRKTVRRAVNLYYIHGTGGESARSKGMLTVDLRTAEVPDADIVVSGHNHQSWATTKARERLSQSGQKYMDQVLHVNVPSMAGRSAWETEKGHQRKVAGSYWLLIEPEKCDSSNKLRVRALEV
jgi:UDP-2,3-diacylglucosamine pyrophosphatase LpxH